MEYQREDREFKSSTRPFFSAGHIIHPLSQEEIDERLRRRYLDRLGLTIKKLRKLLVERKWEELRSECVQLSQSGQTFGFDRLTRLAQATLEAIPPGKVSRATTPLLAKENAEHLITAVDSILIEEQILQPPGLGPR